MYDIYVYYFEGWNYNFNVVIIELMDIYLIFILV